MGGGHVEEIPVGHSGFLGVSSQRRTHPGRIRPLAQQARFPGADGDELILVLCKAGIVRRQPAVLGGVSVEEFVTAVYRDQLIGIIAIDLRPARVDQGRDRRRLVVERPAGVHQGQEPAAGRAAVPGIGSVHHGVPDGGKFAVFHRIVGIAAGIPNGKAHAVAHPQGSFFPVVGAKVIAEGPAQLRVSHEVIGICADAVPCPDLQRIRQVRRGFGGDGQQQGHSVPRRVGQDGQHPAARHGVQSLDIGVGHVIGHLAVCVTAAVIGDVGQLPRGTGRSRCRRDGQQARQQCQRQRQGEEAFPQQCFHTNPLLSSITYHHYPGNGIRCQDRFDTFPAMYTNPLPSTG